jgi:hypothetical protein
MTTQTRKAAVKTAYTLPEGKNPVRRESEVEAILVQCGFTYQNNCKAGSTPYQVYAVPGPEADYKAVLPLLKRQYLDLPKFVGEYVLGRALQVAAGNDELAWHITQTDPGRTEEFYSHRVNTGWKKIQNALKAVEPRRPVVFIMSDPPGRGSTGARNKVTEEMAEEMSENFLEALAKLKG